MLTSRRILIRIAILSAILGVPLLLLSYSWIPFALAEREMGRFSYLPLLGEFGAVLAALTSVGFGYTVRRDRQLGTDDRKAGSRVLVLGLVLLALVVIPNIIGALLLRP